MSFHVEIVMKIKRFHWIRWSSLVISLEGHVPSRVKMNEMNENCHCWWIAWDIQNSQNKQKILKSRMETEMPETKNCCLPQQENRVRRGHSVITLHHGFWCCTFWLSSNETENTLNGEHETVSSVTMPHESNQMVIWLNWNAIKLIHAQRATIKYQSTPIESSQTDSKSFQTANRTFRHRPLLTFTDASRE